MVLWSAATNCPSNFFQSAQAAHFGSSCNAEILGRVILPAMVIRLPPFGSVIWILSALRHWGIITLILYMANIQ